MPAPWIRKSAVHIADRPVEVPVGVSEVSEVHVTLQVPDWSPNDSKAVLVEIADSLGLEAKGLTKPKLIELLKSSPYVLKNRSE